MRWIKLTPARVHVWKIPVLRSCTDSGEWLSPEEQEKSARFHFERDRRRYAVAHTALRLLLSQYLGIAPRQIKFNYGSNGKPEIAALNRHSNLQFNLSHAHDLALIAVTSERRVGIDVEYVRPISDAEEIVRLCFSAKESTAFFELPRPRREKAFFNGWTRKEAFVKALGAGLDYPFDRFDVSWETKARLEIHDEFEHARKWSISSFAPDPNYVAALVVEGAGCETEYHDWTREYAPRMT